MDITPPEHVADLPSRWTQVLETEEYETGGSHSLYHIIANQYAVVYTDPDTPDTPCLIQNITGINLTPDVRAPLEWYELEEFAGRGFSDSEQQAVSAAVGELTVETIEPCLDPDDAGESSVQELTRDSLSIPHDRDRLAEILATELAETDDLTPNEAVELLDEVYGNHLCSISF